MDWAVYVGCGGKTLPCLVPSNNMNGPKQGPLLKCLSAYRSARSQNTGFFLRGCSDSTQPTPPAPDPMLPNGLWRFSLRKISPISLTT